MGKKEKEEPKTKEPVEFVSMVEARVDLTQDLLDLYLPQVLDHFKKQGKSLELAILNQPLRVRDNEVVLAVMGHVQEERANSMKQELISVIRSLTGAGQFRILLEVKEELETVKNKLYTNSDKFNFLLEKHPALKEFRKKFGLETDL